MKNLEMKEVPESPFFPQVLFNAETGKCDISGESYMEETFKFYEPLINWIKEFMESGKALNFNFKLTYFNTSSSRIILDILDLLNAYEKSGNKVEIFWHFDPDDPDMVDEVEDFKVETGADIKLVELNKD